MLGKAGAFHSVFQSRQHTLCPDRRFGPVDTPSGGYFQAARAQQGQKVSHCPLRIKQRSWSMASARRACQLIRLVIFIRWATTCPHADSTTPLP